MGNAQEIARVFGRGRREAVEAKASVFPGVLSPGDAHLAEAEAVFSTWGMPVLSPPQLDEMPKLRAVFYAAGTVEYFAPPLRERGIAISSAWHANAVPVAEFTLAQILLACKGYFANIAGRAFQAPGIYGEQIALLGAGAIGTRVIELLKPHRLDVLVFDPFLTPERATELGVLKVDLETAFREAYVVSNHLLDVPDTYGLVKRAHLESMRPSATLINTGRGRTVVTGDLVEVLRARPDLTALLDVTDPEPLPPGHPLRELPNAVISSHIAGSNGDEVLRMADFAIEEFDRFLRGEPLLYLVP